MNLSCITPRQIAATCEAAAFGEAGWQDVLRQLADAVGGVRGILLGGNGAGTYSHSCVYNHDPEVADLYNRRYNRHDPRAAPSQLVTVGETRLGQDLAANSELAGTEYFDAISRAGDIADSVFGVISDDPEMGRRTVSLQRGFRHEFFGDGEAALLQEVLPALDTAMRNSLRLARVMAEERIGNYLFYALLDPGMGLQILAGDMESTELRLGSLRITPTTLSSESAALQSAILRAAERARRGRTVTLETAALVLRFDPVPPALEWFCAGEGQVFVTGTRHHRLHAGTGSFFAESFGLTPREAELLGALIQDATMRAAADRLGIAHETARWHAKNICTKTGYPGIKSLVAAARCNDLSHLD